MRWEVAVATAVAMHTHAPTNRGQTPQTPPPSPKQISPGAPPVRPAPVRGAREPRSTSGKPSPLSSHPPLTSSNRRHASPRHELRPPRPPLSAHVRWRLDRARKERNAARDGGGGHAAKGADHSHAAILQLLQLHPLQVILRLALRETQNVPLVNVWHDLTLQRVVAVPLSVLVGHLIPLEDSGEGEDLAKALSRDHAEERVHA
mmetsp:Transcript_96894/g.277059  ORF Transcript_96894/g.277059 Transcript_96894/m.277059 type:complete len:204 (-) Transcript_96894:632-1243(-)